MERCKTCPHWATTENTPFHDPWGRDHFCALTMMGGLGEEPPGGPALSISTSGAEAALFTDADFGCVEHPANQRLAFDAAHANAVEAYDDVLRRLADS